ncbi:hypothetical protein [Nonomuraea salmonea]|uniref:Uncharacterized protein n=1 Tax=Nonomuraea salmonea TaxID=46181 RepID=A0ABV5P0W5_9ACTN
MRLASDSRARNGVRSAAEPPAEPPGDGLDRQGAGDRLGDGPAGGLSEMGAMLEELGITPLDFSDQDGGMAAPAIKAGSARGSPVA